MARQSRWGTRATPPSGVHYFRRSETGAWHSACGLISTMRLTRQVRLHAGMAKRGYCCGLCERRRPKEGR